MPKLRDYTCGACGHRFEFLHVPSDEPAACPQCSNMQTDNDIVVASAKPFGTIVPMYKGSLKQKAGYVHTHGNRPAEKGSVAVPRKAGV